MEELNINDLSEMRRQRKKKRNTQKLLGFIIILVVILGLYVSRSRWLPNVRQENSLFTDAEISEGSFPLKLTSGVNYQSCSLKDTFVVVSDTRFYIFSNNGKLIETRQHAYSNIILKHSGKKALIYEQNGNHLRVENKSKTIYEKKMDTQIYMASVSSRGYAAVVTKSDRYVCELRVFDHEGDEIYFRGCSERVMDVVFNADSKGCSIVMIDAVEGHIVSDVISVNFDSPDENWKADDIETCCISSFMTEEGGMFIFGDTMCAGFDGNGNKQLEYQYGSTLIDASFYNGSAAMAFESKERRKTTMVIMENASSGMIEASALSGVKSILADEGKVYILTETSIAAYDYKGNMIDSLELAEPYRDFYRSGKYIILLGHNKIDRVEI